MASTPSFMLLVVLLIGVTSLLAWVVSSALEEQLIGRERRAEAKRSTPARAVATLPRARVHQRS